MPTARNDSSPIDAIVTWVDGNDPRHIHKRRAATLRNLDNSAKCLPAGSDKTRFLDNGELRYCLASIHKFAPWIRCVHLVTDDQIPAFLTQSLQKRYRVRIVDHRETFKSYEWALPTFNSRAIETTLWRVPDIAPRFVYFNDDVVLTNSVRPNDFFEDNKVILRGEWHRLVEYGSTRIIINKIVNSLAKHLLGRTRTMYLKAQMEGARLAGFTDQYFRFTHVPHPIRTITLKNHYQRFPAQFSRNIGYRFRDLSQHLPVALANHIEISNGNAILTGKTSLISVFAEQQSKRRIKNILDNISTGDEKFLCLTSIERLDSDTLRYLDHVMNRILA